MADQASAHQEPMHDHMMMYFHFTTHATILFKGWKTMNWEEMLGSCIAVFVMTVLYEGLKCGREILLKRSTNLSKNKVTITKPVYSSQEPVIISEKEQRDMSIASRMCSIAHLIQSLLHVIQFVLSYFLMLIFMTYNGWLCISMSIGAGVGYFLFAWNRNVVVDSNEHCH